jgi:hypothetical protein
VNRFHAALFLALAALSAFAEVDVSIRFSDKRIYYPESPIAIKVSLANNTPATFRFRLAENRMYSLDFEARTPTNRRLDSASLFKKSRADSSPVYYREVSVEPGEEYSFVENLGDYVAIAETGTFAVQANFWIDLAPRSSDDHRPALTSNVLMLSVRPSPAGIPTMAEAIRRETGEILRPEAIALDEVVRRTIEARQRSRWNEFFLYLDLESLLKKSPELARSYNRESDEGRQKMLDKFRLDLQGPKAESPIVTLPSEFEILETRYTANLGFVRALEKFQEKGFTSVKEYEYELRRREEVWFIVGYSVVNKGTE